MHPKYLYAFTVALFVALVVSSFSPKFGLSKLAGFGGEWTQPRLHQLDNLPVYVRPNSGGYDGQFYAQIALDPTLRSDRMAQAIDSPSYRARRILLPAIAYVVGLGNPSAVLQVYCSLNIIFWFVLGILLLRWLPPDSWTNAARWSLCMLSMGALESVRYSLTDLPSLTLAVAAIQLLERRKRLPAALAQIASVTSKETALVGTLALLDNSRKQQPFVKRILFAAAVGLASLAVFGIWTYYISTVFPLAVEVKGNIGLPFAGLVRGIWEALVQIVHGHELDRFAFRIVAVLGLLYQAYHLARYRNPKSRIWILGICYALLFVTLGDNVWWGYWAACRVALPMTLAFNIRFEARDRTTFWTLLALCNLPALHAIARWL